VAFATAAAHRWLRHRRRRRCFLLLLRRPGNAGLARGHARLQRLDARLNLRGCSDGCAREKANCSNRNAKHFEIPEWWKENGMVEKKRREPGLVAVVPGDERPGERRRRAGAERAV
jgi:hypothetical protein